jgi:hypothetical protein
VPLGFLGRLVGITGTVEDEAGAMAPVHRPGLYVSLAVVLIFVLATYLASGIRGEDLASVSVVQEPTVSQLPSGIALVGNVEDEERNAEDPNKENQPEKQAAFPTIVTGNDEKIRAERSGLKESPSGTVQVSSSSAAASASASASASPASTGSASVPATSTPAPARVEPKPAARGQRAGGGMADPAGPPARVSGRQSLQETQAGPFDATRLGDGVPNKVRKAVDSAW